MILLKEFLKRFLILVEGEILLKILIFNDTNL